MVLSMKIIVLFIILFCWYIFIYMNGLLKQGTPMNHAEHNGGFTTLEVIAVVLLIGIISAFVVSKNMDLGGKSYGAAEVIKNHIRYSQILAMKSNTVCGIEFRGNVYSIFINGSVSDRITLPASGSDEFSIPSALAGASETIYFDLWGIPHTDPGAANQRPTGQIGSLGITMYGYTGYVK